jgi:hypothetical protein
MILARVVRSRRPRAAGLCVFGIRGRLTLDRVSALDLPLQTEDPVDQARRIKGASGLDC